MALAKIDQPRSFSAKRPVDCTLCKVGAPAVTGGFTLAASGIFGSSPGSLGATPAVGGCGVTGAGDVGLASAFGSGVFSPGGASGAAEVGSSFGSFAFGGSGAPIVVAISLLNSGNSDAKPFLPCTPLVASSKSK